MAEFSTVSASSFDPTALAGKLTEKTSEGWDVVAILPTGGDITAFLRRAGESPQPGQASEFSMVEEAPATEQSPWVASAEPVAEPAGWASAPDRSPAPEPTVVTPVQTPTPAPASTPAVPAGWYADPAGRFELRYWDGGAWTEHVSRAGQQFTDPPVA